MTAMTAMMAGTAMVKTRKKKTRRTKTGRMKTGRTKTGKMKTGKTKTGKTKTGKMKTGKTKTGRTKTGRTKTIARTQTIAKESVERLIGLRTCLKIALMRTGNPGNAAITFHSSPFKSWPIPARRIPMVFTLSRMIRVPITGSFRTHGAQAGVRMASFALRSPMTRWVSSA